MEKTTSLPPKLGGLASRRLNGQQQESLKFNLNNMKGHNHQFRDKSPVPLLNLDFIKDNYQSRSQGVSPSGLNKLKQNNKEITMDDSNDSQSDFFEGIITPKNHINDQQSMKSLAIPSDLDKNFRGIESRFNDMESMLNQSISSKAS